MDTGEAMDEIGENPPRKHAGKRNKIIFVVVTLINIGLLALLWTQLLTPAHTSSSQGPRDPLIGQAAPAFTLPTLDQKSGQALSLTDFKGKAVVLNFWSSTCSPCKDEMPLLETQWERVKAQNIVFLGIDVEDTASDGLAFLNKYGATYASVIDTSGRTLVDYGVIYTPETIFIDRTGKVIGAVRMQITPQQLQDNLQKSLQ